MNKTNPPKECQRVAEIHGLNLSQVTWDQQDRQILINGDTPYAEWCREQYADLLSDFPHALLVEMILDSTPDHVAIQEMEAIPITITITFCTECSSDLVDGTCPLGC